MSTPALSPTSLVYETELESLPHQSLRQATTVHLGQRPNLKSMQYFPPMSEFINFLRTDLFICKSHFLLI
jgi:hypothetical protein